MVVARSVGCLGLGCYIGWVLDITRGGSGRKGVPQWPPGGGQGATGRVNHSSRPPVTAFSSESEMLLHPASARTPARIYGRLLLPGLTTAVHCRTESAESHVRNSEKTNKGKIGSGESS